MFNRFSYIEDLISPPFHRSWTRDFELPKAGGCSTKTDGVDEICTGWRGLLISGEIYLLCLSLTIL
jgi:hypothetical protein